MSSRIRSNFAVSHGTGPWHPSGKLVELLPMGSPSQDRDAGSNAAGATHVVGAGEPGVGPGRLEAVASPLALSVPFARDPRPVQESLEHAPALRAAALEHRPHG